MDATESTWCVADVDERESQVGSLHLSLATVVGEVAQLALGRDVVAVTIGAASCAGHRDPSR